MPETIDRTSVKEFANRLLDIYAGGFLTYMIEIGEATGLFTDLMDALGRHRYDDLLVSVYLGLAPGLLERLAGGISVADIGCGSGHVANLMGQAFPRSSFVGYDMSDTGIAVATSEADSMSLANVRFELLDLVQLPEEPKFDLITAFDVIHDQARPADALARVTRALAPSGTFYTFDIPASSRLEANIPTRLP